MFVNTSRKHFIGTRPIDIIYTNAVKVGRGRTAIFVSNDKNTSCDHSSRQTLTSTAAVQNKRRPTKKLSFQLNASRGVNSTKNATDRTAVVATRDWIFIDAVSRNQQTSQWRHNYRPTKKKTAVSLVDTTQRNAQFSSAGSKWSCGVKLMIVIAERRETKRFIYF